MPLLLNDEQLLLKESLERFIEKDYSFEARERIRVSDEPFSRDMWRQFAELGLTAIGIPETYGGLGGGTVEQSVACEALGRAMVLEPYLSAAVIAPRAILATKNEALKSELLKSIAEGELFVTLGFAERNARYETHHVETQAVGEAESYRLTGEKVAVLDGASADKFIISARTGGNPRDELGVALFLVERDAPGLEVAAFPMMNGTFGCDLVLSDVPATLLVDGDEGHRALSAAVEDGIAASAALATGAMSASYEQTLEYVKTREQFGVAIGTFQALQHRLVAMFMAVRECQSMVLMTASELASDDALERAKTASSAKAYVGKRARHIAQEIVQMHGGIGMTEELAIGHFFRNLTLFTTLFGSADYHLQRYAELSRQA